MSWDHTFSYIFTSHLFIFYILTSYIFTFYICKFYIFTSHMCIVYIFTSYIFTSCVCRSYISRSHICIFYTFIPYIFTCYVCRSYIFTSYIFRFYIFRFYIFCFFLHLKTSANIHFSICVLHCMLTSLQQHNIRFRQLECMRGKSPAPRLRIIILMNATTIKRKVCQKFLARFAAYVPYWNACYFSWKFSTSSVLKHSNFVPGRCPLVTEIQVALKFPRTWLLQTSVRCKGTLQSTTFWRCQKTAETQTVQADVLNRRA